VIYRIYLGITLMFVTITLWCTGAAFLIPGNLSADLLTAGVSWLGAVYTLYRAARECWPWDSGDGQAQEDRG